MRRRNVVLLLAALAVLALAVRLATEAPAPRPEAIDRGEARTTREGAILRGVEGASAETPPPGDVALRGVVLDDEDRPAAGVPVEAWPARDPAGTGDPARRVMDLEGGGYDEPRAAAPRVRGPTDAAGTFRLEGLDLDRRAWWVAARPPAPLAGTRRRVLTDLDRSAAPFAVLHVRAGSRLRGRVVDASDRAVTAWVEATDGGYGFDDGEHWSGGPPVATSTDGRFSFAAVPGGGVFLALSVPTVWRRDGIRVETPTSDEVVLRVGTSDGAAVTGEVTDDHDAPVVGAEVTIVVQQGAVQTTRVAGSGPDGRYGFLHLEPGRLSSLRVDAKGLSLASRVPSGVPLGEGKSVRLDLRLTGGAVVTGHVRGADGAPVANARVTAQVGEDLALDGSATAEKDGSYRLEGLGAGATTIRASATGFYDRDLPSGYRDLALPNVWVGPAGDAIEHDLVLLPCPVVRGHVVDESGKPVSGATVEARADVMHAPVGPIVRADTPHPAVRSGEDGSFTFADLVPVLAWSLRAESEGRVSEILGPIDLHPDEAPPPLELVVRPAASIAGTVVDEAGRPRPGVRVALSGAPLSPAILGPRIDTDAEGGFRFDRLAGGSYTVTAYVRQGAAASSRSIGLDLAWGEHATDVRLTVGGPGESAAAILETDDEASTGTRPYEIRVLDADGHSVASGSASFSTFAGDEQLPGGWATLFRGRLYATIPARADRVQLLLRDARDAGGRRLNVVLEPTRILDPSVPNPSIELERGHVLAGRVTDTEGHGIEAVRLSVTDLDDVSVFTDREGRFEIPGLPGAEARIDVRSRPPWVEGDVRTLPTEAGPVTIVLERGADVEVHVLDPDGHALSGALVTVDDANDEHHSDRTREDGRVRFERLAPRDWTLGVRHDGYRPVVRTGVEPGGGPIEIRMEEELAIEGEVLDARGDPVTAGTVWAEPLDDQPGMRRTPAALDGHTNRFRIGGLVPGRYRLVMYANRALPDGVVPVETQAPAHGVVLRGRAR